jgi:hypothetical protein
MNPRINFIFVLALVAGFARISSGADKAPALFPITEFGPNWPQPGSIKGGFIDQTGAVVVPPSSDIFPPHHFHNEAYFSEGLEPVEVQVNTKWPPLAWGYMDTKGNFAIEPQFGLALPFSEGLAAVRVKNGFGYIDSTGKFVIPPQFEQAGPFVDDLAAVRNPETTSWASSAAMENG